MPDLSQTRSFPFVCEGGLISNRSTFVMQPGQALELENFEPDVEGGYKRINGFQKHVRQQVPQTSASTEQILMVATFANKVIAARGEKIFSSASTQIAEGATNAIAADTSMTGSGTITVKDTTGFSSSGTIQIDSEQFTYTGKTSTTFTGVTRAANSTTAAAHASGVQVAQFNDGGIPQFIVRTPDNNYLLHPFPTKSYTIKFDYFTFPSDMSAHSDTTSIPDRFAPIIADGATAFVYQYRGETQQYQLNMQRFEQGIKNMQTLLVNRFDYIRSTYIPRSGYLTGADTPLRIS